VPADPFVEWCTSSAWLTVGGRGDSPVDGDDGCALGGRGQVDADHAHRRLGCGRSPLIIASVYGQGPRSIDAPACMPLAVDEVVRRSLDAGIDAQDADLYSPGPFGRV
jgi:hypothetical protein